MVDGGADGPSGEAGEGDEEEIGPEGGFVEEIAFEGGVDGIEMDFGAGHGLVDGGGVSILVEVSFWADDDDFIFKEGTVLVIGLPEAGQKDFVNGVGAESSCGASEAKADGILGGNLCWAAEFAESDGGEGFVDLGCFGGDSGAEVFHGGAVAHAPDHAIGIGEVIDITDAGIGVIAWGNQGIAGAGKGGGFAIFVDGIFDEIAAEDDLLLVLVEGILEGFVAEFGGGKE